MNRRPLPDRLRILFDLCGDRRKASSRVRGYWIAEELERLGCACTLHSSGSKLDMLRCAALIPRHDVIVFQKTYSRYSVLLARLAKARDLRVFFDIDDAPSRVQRPDTLARAAEMMRLSDGVLAGCANLARLALEHQPNTHLVPSAIRLADYPVPSARPQPERLCLGWIGNGAYYAADLAAILVEPLAGLAARHPLRLKIVGACGERRIGEAFAQIPGLEVELVDAVDWSDGRAVAAAIADFDIGLYPLLDNDFNRYKCGFKALEYMAMGLPVVASDAPSVASIVSSGHDGYLVDGAFEWTERLRLLIENKALRDRLGRSGRRKVEEAFSTARIAASLLGVFAGEAAPFPRAADLAGKPVPAVTTSAAAL